MSVQTQKLLSDYIQDKLIGDIVETWLNFKDGRKLEDGILIFASCDHLANGHLAVYAHDTVDDKGNGIKD